MFFFSLSLHCFQFVTSSDSGDSLNEEYYSHPTRISLLDDWLAVNNDGEEEEMNEEIVLVVCGSRFTALLTSNYRVLLL